MRKREGETKRRGKGNVGNTGWQDNQQAKLFTLGNQLRTWRTHTYICIYIYIYIYIYILAAVPVNTLHFLLFYHLSGFLCYFCARLVADLTWVQRGGKERGHHHLLCAPQIEISNAT